jgi:frataxin-like iron-binding protein CyaY
MNLNDAVTEAVASVAIAERMLDLCLDDAALDLLTKQQLQQLWLAVQVFDRHKQRIRPRRSLL